MFGKPNKGKLLGMRIGFSCKTSIQVKILAVAVQELRTKFSESTSPANDAATVIAELINYQNRIRIGMLSLWSFHGAKIRDESLP